ncbi:hypothetical protein BC567DRAFT_72706 [Phyllosticta citribraziliensis]
MYTALPSIYFLWSLSTLFTNFILFLLPKPETSTSPSTPLPDWHTRLGRIPRHLPGYNGAYAGCASSACKHADGRLTPGGHQRTTSVIFNLNQLL